jgi:hypothetical protein
MLKRIVMQVSGLVTVRFTAAYIQLTICLSRTVRRLLALITQLYHSALTPLLPLAKTLSSFKAWAANPTTVVQSIKLALKRVATISGQIGLRLATIARQTLQRAKASLKKDK